MNIASKEYLINSIHEMEEFNDKIVSKIHENKNTISDKSLKVFLGIIERKNENIKRFKELLSTHYNCSI